MDVTAVHLLPECYRGSSPRSASTPGPAPDSPASASGRFSASPLLSPAGFPYYAPYLAAGVGVNALHGLGAFLSSNPSALLAPYAAYHHLHHAVQPHHQSPPSMVSFGHHCRYLFPFPGLMQQQKNNQYSTAQC